MGKKIMKKVNTLYQLVSKFSFSPIKESETYFQQTETKQKLFEILKVKRKEKSKREKKKKTSIAMYHI